VIGDQRNGLLTRLSVNRAAEVRRNTWLAQCVLSLFMQLHYRQ